MSSISRMLIVMRNAWSYAYGNPKIYHAGKQKSCFNILMDLLIFSIIKKEFFALYYAFGKNQKGQRSLEGVFGTKEYLSLRTKIQNLIVASNKDNMDYQVVTKNKYYARSILEANGMRAVPDIGLIRNGVLLLCSGIETSLTEYLEREDRDFYLKNTILEAGEGIIRIKSHRGILTINHCPIDAVGLTKRLGSYSWVLQDRIFTHPLLAEVKSGTLNTLRIVTVIDEGTPSLLSGFTSFGLGDSGIDSWAKGAIYVGIDMVTGKLKSPGYTSPISPLTGLVNKHPESLIEFDGLRIPFWDEVINSCLHGHKLFYNCFIIGWDIAITDSGPMILEVNEKPGMNVIQCLDQSLYVRFMDVCARNTQFYKHSIDKHR